MTFVTLHLGIEAERAELEAITHPVNLIENLLGRLVGYRPSARVTENEGCVT
jgi:hypothetical protein